MGHLASLDLLVALIKSVEDTKNSSLFVIGAFQDDALDDNSHSPAKKLPKFILLHH